MDDTIENDCTDFIDITKILRDLCQDPENDEKDGTIENDCTDFIDIFKILRELYQDPENVKRQSLQKKNEYALACIIFWISNNNKYWSKFISCELLKRIRDGERISGSKEHPNQRTKTVIQLLNDKKIELIKTQDFLEKFKDELCLWHLVTSKENGELDPRRKKGTEVHIVRITEKERKLIQSQSKNPERIEEKMSLIDEILGNKDQRETKILKNEKP